MASPGRRQSPRISAQPRKDETTQGANQRRARSDSPLAGSSIRAGAPLRAAKSITRPRAPTKPTTPVAGHLEQYAHLKNQNLRLYRENEELRKSCQRIHIKLLRQEGANEALKDVVQDMRQSTNGSHREGDSVSDQPSTKSEVGREQTAAVTQQPNSTLSFLADAVGRLYYSLFVPRPAVKQRYRPATRGGRTYTRQRSLTHGS